LAARRLELEALESRICPSTLNFGAVVVTPSDPLTLGGNKLIELASGKAIVYVTETGIGDPNRLDADDIVGISISKGTNLTSNVDIHGDIVTNLNKNGTLSGENRDGSVLVAKATIPGLTINGSVDGQILATGNIGGQARILTEESGLLDAEFHITITGSANVIANGTAAGGRDIFANVNAIVAGVNIGPVTLEAFEQTKGGPSIAGIEIQAAESLTLIQAGDGGPAGRGGQVFDILIQGAGSPYAIIAGDGGSATKPGAGGSIFNIIQTDGSVNGAILYRAGSGGDGFTKSGGAGGSIDTLSLNGSGQYALLAGEGGEGGSDEFVVSKADGGMGGNIRAIRLENGTGYTLIAGNGGDGDRHGGQGGSVSLSNNQGNIPSLFQPTSVVNADFDKDGDLDLLVLSATSDNFTIYFNDGDGNFVPRGIFSTGLNPQRAAILDIDGDDNLDLFITNKDDDTVGVHLGNGDGTFDTPVFLDTGVAPIGVALAQVNSFGDNLFDLLVVNSFDRTISIFFGTGGGQFNLNGITTLDIATLGDPNVLLATDLNNDGVADIAVANPDTLNADVDSVYVFVGNGVFLGGDATFSGPTNFLVGDLPSALASGLLNGDARPDLVTANEGSDNISILFGNPAVVFPEIGYQSAVNITVGNAPSDVGIVNLNGGLSDLVVANSSDNTISVLLNQGGGTFATPTSWSVGAEPVSLTTGDFNGDGNQDVVTANAGSFNLSLLFGNGDGTFEVAGQDTAGAILQAGSGGDGRTGNGGNGGNLGLAPNKPQPEIQSPDVEISALGGALMVARAGDGGDGFINGGKGGTISSVTLLAAGNVLIQAGDGGQGQTGQGGDGGLLGRGAPSFDVAVTTGGGNATIHTGSGGDGATAGGNGGHLTNTQVGSDGDMEVATGSGGDATVSGRGGESGNINNSEITSAGQTLITTGKGGDSIGQSGRNGGSLLNSTLIISGSTAEEVDVLITLGDGGSGTTGGVGGQFRRDVIELTPTGFEMTVQIETGSGGNGITSGGAGGELEFIELTSTSEEDSSLTNLYVDLGAGGDATSGAGGDGGSLSGLHVSGVNGDLEINNVTGGNHGRGGNGLSGGRGGSVSTVDQIPPDATEGGDGEIIVSIGGTLTVRSGDGGSATSGNGGRAGDVSAIKGEFQGVVDHADIPDTSGLRLLAGAGGASTSGAGGAGGTVNNIDVASLETEISYVAGDGGSGSTAGGAGGNLIRLTGNSSEALLFQAGNGGNATGLGGFGGAGGNVDDIFQAANPGQLIRQIVAGNGGDALALGGIGGNGGSINKVNVLGDIGDFTLTYGYNSMGGLIAGAGGIGQTADGTNGSITNVTAGRIAAIVAGTAVGPVPVAFLDKITANAIGANTDPNDPGEFVFPAFDFIDLNDDGLYTLGADPDSDPAETPIDGLILADVIGSINLPQGVLPLFTYEVSNPPPIGNIDPHPV
jgi:hypothetical protein